MIQATLDLFDSELRNSTNHYIQMNNDDRLKLLKFDIRIDPIHSDKYFNKINNCNLEFKDPIKLSEKPDLSQISDDLCGIYLFVVQPTNLILNMPKYVLYIGISGANNSNRSLKKRLSDYLNINTVSKRNNIHKMMQLFYDHLYIYYAYFGNDSNFSINDIEIAFHEYFSPHFAKAAFEVNTKKSNSAW